MRRNMHLKISCGISLFCIIIMTVNVVYMIAFDSKALHEFSFRLITFIIPLNIVYLILNLDIGMRLRGWRHSRLYPDRWEKWPFCWWCFRRHGSCLRH